MKTFPFAHFITEISKVQSTLETRFADLQNLSQNFFSTEFWSQRVILNPVDISVRGASRTLDLFQVILQNVLTLYKFLRIISEKPLGKPFRKLVWNHYYLLKGTELDLDLCNPSSIRKLLI